MSVTWRPMVTYTARELLVDRQRYLGYREILNRGGSCYPSPPYQVLHTRPPPLARVHLFDLICPSVPTLDWILIHRNQILFYSQKSTISHITTPGLGELHSVFAWCSGTPWYSPACPQCVGAAQAGECPPSYQLHTTYFFGCLHKEKN